MERAAPNDGSGAAARSGWRGGAEQALGRGREALGVLAGTPRVLRLVWQAHPVLATALVALSAAQGLVPLAQFWITKLIVDAVAATLGALGSAATLDAGVLGVLGGFPGSLGGGDVVGTVLRLLALQVVVAVAGQAAEPASRLVIQQLGDYVSRDVTLRMLRKANAQVDLGPFESPGFYDLLQRAQQEANHRPVTILQQLTGLLRGAVGLASMVAVLLAFEPLLALAVAALALPHVVIQFRNQYQSWGLWAWEVPELRFMNYLKQLLTGRDSAKEVRVFGLADHFLGRYLALFAAYHERHRRLSLAQWRWNTALAVLAAVGSTGAYAYVVLQALAGRITLGGLTFYASAVNQVQGSLATIVTQLASLYEGNLFVGHLFEFLALEPTMALPPPEAARPAPRPLRAGIELRGVAFRYPGAEREVLRDVSFAIRPGQTVALVGENGAGKTTLVKLLARLYDPTAGQVLVDGVDLREYDLESWRRQLAVTFQDFSRFHLAAGENIGVGEVARVGDAAAVAAAAARSGADAVVERLPDGYDTFLGRAFYSYVSNGRSFNVQEGVDLSGGEWQKIALARAFMRTGAGSGRDDDELAPGAQLLILDEPTAALDAKAEYEIYLRFHELTRGRATLLISHRLSTVRMADLIVVLEDGRVVEQGSHAALIAAGGRYADLFEKQASRYR